MGIIVLSLGDLLITITYLRSTGMIEANPIAECLIRLTGSLSVLALYKAVTVGVCVGLLYRLRHHVEGEVAAWCAVAILAVMSFQWHHYTRQFDHADVELAHRWALSDEWLRLD